MDDWKGFVLEAPRTAKVATTRENGDPHVAPVWVAVDGDDIVFGTGPKSVKGRNIARNPHVCICFDDERPPFSFCIIEGTASWSEDPAELLKWATIIAGRYMGEDKAEEIGKRNGVPGEWLVRVRPTRVVLARDIAK